MGEEQKISSLTAADEQRLDAQRAVIEKYVSPAYLKAKYATPAGKLGALRAIISANIFKADATYELQSVGIVFGDVFVEEMGFHWVIVEDEYGRDSAIRYKKTSILLFPLTMISKRIEKGENVDVIDLYNGISNKVEQLIEDGA